MQAYHHEYIPEVDLLVVVLVGARSSDFDQPHPRNLPHIHHPHQQQEPQKYQQQHQQFGLAEEGHGSLSGGLFPDVEVVGVVAVVAEVRQEQPVVVVENATAIQQTCYRALFQTSSPCHLSSPWPLQICLSHLAPVHSSFAEIYHVAVCSSGSPNQSHRLVILPWLSANRNTQEYDPTDY